MELIIPSVLYQENNVFHKQKRMEGSTNFKLQCGGAKLGIPRCRVLCNQMTSD